MNLVNDLLKSICGSTASTCSQISLALLSFIDTVQMIQPKTSCKLSLLRRILLAMKEWLTGRGTALVRSGGNHCLKKCSSAFVRQISGTSSGVADSYAAVIATSFPVRRLFFQDVGTLYQKACALSIVATKRARRGPDGTGVPRRVFGGLSPYWRKGHRGQTTQVSPCRLRRGSP